MAVRVATCSSFWATRRLCASEIEAKVRKRIALTANFMILKQYQLGKDFVGRFSTRRAIFGSFRGLQCIIWIDRRCQQDLLSTHWSVTLVHTARRCRCFTTIRGLSIYLKHASNFFSDGSLFRDPLLDTDKNFRENVNCALWLDKRKAKKVKMASAFK